MKKKMAMVAAACLVAVVMGGCSVFAPASPVSETFVNGTSAGNIQNLGFAVKQNDDLYFYYTAGDAYERGDVVKSNPETGENSLLFHNGGLYMNMVNGSLYFCREDGIYRTPMDTLEPQLVKKCRATQLQLSGGKMYYIEDGALKCISVDGEEVDFTAVANAECLIVDNNLLYYIDSKTGQIWQAEMDGSGTKIKLNVSAKQFVVQPNAIYYLDSNDSMIKRVTADDPAPKTVVPYVCRSFNVNSFGLYYTREVNGQWVCCNADADGKNEQQIEDSETKNRHMICMFNGGAVILREEDFEPAA